LTAKGRKLREHQASRAPEHTRHVLWGALVHRQAWRAKAMQLRNGFLQCCHVGAQGMCTEARASGTSFPVDSGVSASGNPCPIPYGDRLILRNTYPPAHATTWGQCAHAGKDFDVQAPHVRAAWRPAHAQPRGRAAIDRNRGAEVGQHVVDVRLMCAVSMHAHCCKFCKRECACMHANTRSARPHASECKRNKRT